MGRISRYARTSPHPPAHSLHEIACVNSLAAGYAALGRARVLKQLGGARGRSGSLRCECGVWAGHQSCPISSASGSKGAVGIICRCRYSVCLSTTHNTLRCTHHGYKDLVWVGSRDAAPLLVYANFILIFGLAYLVQTPSLHLVQLWPVPILIVLSLFLFKQNQRESAKILSKNW